MEYRSVKDLSKSVRSLTVDLPKNIDLIVCIPRSGLLAGSLLALHLNISVTDIEGYLSGNVFDTGTSRKKKETDVENAEHILVVDDSVRSGSQMEETKQRLSSVRANKNIIYAAIYVSELGTKYVDYYGEVVDTPRFFEWNIMHHPSLSKSVLDIQVLLGKKGNRLLKESAQLTKYEPNIVPKETINMIVGSATESHRKNIENWLDLNDIQYNKLLLYTEDQSKNKEVRYKSKLYRSEKLRLFIEYGREEAILLAEQSGKPVYCYSENTMIQPNMMAEKIQYSEEYVARFADDPINFLKTAYKYLANSVRSKINLLRNK